MASVILRTSGLGAVKGFASGADDEALTCAVASSQDALAKPPPQAKPARSHCLRDAPTFPRPTVVLMHSNVPACAQMRIGANAEREITESISSLPNHLRVLRHAQGWTDAYRKPENKIRILMTKAPTHTPVRAVGISPT